MDVEILFDFEDVTPENRSITMQKFEDWYLDGSEVRHNTISFGSLTRFDSKNSFLVNFGYVDPIPAIRNLHARVRNLGVKFFVHFIH